MWRIDLKRARIAQKKFDLRLASYYLVEQVERARMAYDSSLYIYLVCRRALIVVNLMNAEITNL